MTPRRLALASLLMSSVCLTVVPINAQNNLKATHGGVAVGGSVHGDIGITSDALRAAVKDILQQESLTAGRQKELEVQVAGLSEELGVTREAVGTFLGILDVVDIDESQLVAKLSEIAEQHLVLRERMILLVADDPVVQELINKAQAAIEQGAYDQADDFLTDAENAQLAAVRQAQKLAEQALQAVDDGLIKAAATRARRGEISLTQLSYADAAEHFAKAVEILPEGKKFERADYLGQQAFALRSLGHNHGDNVALHDAIEINHQILAMTPRAQMPKKWASTQSELGMAHLVLGSRQNNPENLKHAISAFQAALEESARENVPLLWAETQNNLGMALKSLGSRQMGTATMLKAVDAYDAALEVVSRTQTPAIWANIKNNLCIVLNEMGNREGGTVSLNESVSCFKEVLAEQPRDRFPLEWASTQSSLGEVYKNIGVRESGTANLERAVDAFRAALEERTQERMPMQWARTQQNLGTALKSIGRFEGGTERLEEAIEAYDLALEVWTRERAPVHWAWLKKNVGDLLRVLGSREHGTTRLYEAITAYKEALEVRTQNDMPLAWASTQHNLGTALDRKSVV